MNFIDRREQTLNLIEASSSVNSIRNTKKKMLYSLFLLCMAMMMSCSEDSLSTKSIFPDGEDEVTELDIWLNQYFVAPYNITWEYRLVDGEQDLTYYIVPIDYLQAVRFAIAFKHVILEGYEEVWGAIDKVKKYYPKYLALAGNYAYNNNGTIVLGTAEAGIKITYYGVNHIDFYNIILDSEENHSVVRRFKTAHHEFAHAMHQQIPFSDDFRNVSLSDYVEDDWNSRTLADALNNGFVTLYARKNANEDFAEIYSCYVNYTKASWDARIAGASTDGLAKINEKLSILRTYMKTNWDLDLDKLRRVSIRRLEELDNLNLTDLTLK